MDPVRRFSLVLSVVGVTLFSVLLVGEFRGGLVVMGSPTPVPVMSFLLTPETVPVTSEGSEEGVPLIPKTPTPEMVPVSSTVIPVVTNVKPQASARQLPAVRYTSRRFSFFDKSSKPDAPIRLITKNTNLKKFYESVTPS